METLHGARQKWNGPGRPALVIEEPRGLGPAATGGMDGLEATEGGIRAPAPQLPLPRQDTLGAGVVTPQRRDADGHGVLRAGVLFPVAISGRERLPQRVWESHADPEIRRVSKPVPELHNLRWTRWIPGVHHGSPFPGKELLQGL